MGHSTLIQCEYHVSGEQVAQADRWAWLAITAMLRDIDPKLHYEPVLLRGTDVEQHASVRLLYVLNVDRKTVDIVAMNAERGFVIVQHRVQLDA